MTTPNGLDRRLTDWLMAEAPPGAPDALLAEVRDRAVRTRRRPAWATSERWISMETRARLGAIPRSAIVLVTLGLMAALLTSIALGAGGSPAPPDLPPPWGPAGNGLIAHDGGADIWVMEPDGSHPQQLTSGPTMDYEPSWSPDGQLLAYWEVAGIEGATSSGDPASGTPSLVIIDAAGKERGRLAIPGRLTYEYTTPPSWAPDSRRLVIGYQDAATPAEATLAIVDVADMSLVPLGKGTSPTWSPQGTWIAYRRLRLPTVDMPIGVGIIRPDGTYDHQVTKVSGGDYAFAFPQWSMDEQYLTFYALYGGGHDVWVARSDGTQEWAIGDEPPEEYWPSFSPDGERVAFQRDLPGQSLAFNYVVADPDGANPVDVPSALLSPALPGVWAPDGTLLLGIHGTHTTTIDLYELDPTGVAEPVVIPLSFDWVNLSWQRVAP